MRTSPARHARSSRSQGFTLWELTIVLAVMAVAATLAAPAFARFGTEQPAGAADAVINLLRDARKASLDFNANVTVRLDPKTLRYQVDTAGVGGFGQLADGTLDMGLTRTLESPQPRVAFVFTPTGATFADSVIVRGGVVPMVVHVDAWSGVAHVDTLK
jgi:prepilin-type N-terminal cleavage/methylation domain-containing protein